MANSSFFWYLSLLLYKNRLKYISIVTISTLIVFIFSCVVFITGSIKTSIEEIHKNQADFIVQRIVSGKVSDTPLSRVEKLLELNGISYAQARVYGRYYYEPAEEYFNIVGVDFFDKQIQSDLKKVVANLDIEKFLEKDHMIIGEGVQRLFDYYEYKGNYNFRPPNRSIKKVFIYDNFPVSSNIISSDMVIVDIDVAKEILGISEDYCTDIVLNVENKNEWDTIKNKIRINYFDTRIVTKDDILKEYNSFFEYKSSFFYILYILLLATFILIIYQRYTFVNIHEKKYIATLRTIGWSIKDIIKLKLFENFIIFFSAYIFGVLLAYIYVFILKAPVLSNIFLGFKNLQSSFVFSPYFDISLFSFIFIFFIIPIMTAILIPIWKIAITPAYEALK